MDTIQSGEKAMTLQRAGCFGWMPEDEAIVLLNELKSGVPRPDQETILKYLRSGTQAFAIPGLAEDLLSPSRAVIGPPHIFTDGEWIWSADLLHYIQHYNVEVPAAFVRRMRERNWTCPPVMNLEELDFGLWDN